MLAGRSSVRMVNAAVSASVSFWKKPEPDSAAVPSTSSHDLATSGGAGGGSRERMAAANVFPTIVERDFVPEALTEPPFNRIGHQCSRGVVPHGAVPYMAEFRLLRVRVQPGQNSSDAPGDADTGLLDNLSQSEVCRLVARRAKHAARGDAPARGDPLDKPQVRRLELQQRRLELILVDGVVRPRERHALLPRKRCDEAILKVREMDVRIAQEASGDAEALTQRRCYTRVDL
eukprot:1669732-Prymnesium_polylepis.2